jgi:hypothetical protein
MQSLWTQAEKLNRLRWRVVEATWKHTSGNGKGYMAKVRNPARLSEVFGIAPDLLEKVGVLNVTLNVDTRLFIDPLLLDRSVHPEFSRGAYDAYNKNFETAIKLLVESKIVNDVYWRNARPLLSFPEIMGTCLGYGAGSVAGSGSGEKLTDRLMETGKAIVDLGVKDPDMFVAMALFENDFGADRISDMTANIIIDPLLQFNARVLKSLPIPVEQFHLVLKSGKSFDVQLPRNRYMKGRAPVILVPTDVLRDLPVAADWEEVAAAASHNAEIRSRVNEHVAELWRRKTLKDKETLRDWALTDKDAFEALLQMLHEVTATAYDVPGDPRGVLFWRQILISLAEQHPFHIEKPQTLGIHKIIEVVEQIIKQFKFLIEERRLSRELFYRGETRPEKAAQMLFFAVAYSYCKSNNLDITPEADTNSGPVDFKVSSGFNARIMVEIKLSTNPKVVSGYTRQLQQYKTSEETLRGFYVVLDVGEFSKKKRKGLRDAEIAAQGQNEPVSPIIVIDGHPRPSASKL